MTISWNDRLSTGVEWMDAQHRELLSRIDSLIDGIKENRGTEILGGLVKFLDAYVEVHFGDERKEMTRHAYPEKDRHLAEHAEFTETLRFLKNKLAAEGVTPQTLIQAKRDLLDWFINHICETDRRLGNYLQNKV